MPITKKTASRSRKPSHPKSKAIAVPAPVAETQLAAGASDVLDPIGEAPAPAAETVETATPSGEADTTETAADVAEEEVVEEQAEQPAPDVVAEVEAAADPAPTDPVVEEPAVEEPRQSSAADNRIRLGHVEGVLHRVPVSAVQSILVDHQDRIAVLRTSAQVLALHGRMRETEGRCAPIVFSMEPDADRPHILSGLEAFAAAQNIELSSVYVITVPAEDAGAVQSYLAHQANTKPTDGSEEDLIRQVLSYDD